jgi:hypothetical protein
MKNKKEDNTTVLIFIGLPKRISLYGNQSLCVRDIYPDLISFCFCRSLILKDLVT